jgi:hypothetical protein
MHCEAASQRATLARHAPFSHMTKPGWQTLLDGQSTRRWRHSPFGHLTSPNKQANVSVHFEADAAHEPSGHTTWLLEHVFSVAQFSARAAQLESRHWNGVGAMHATVGSGGQLAGLAEQLVPSGQI